MSFETVITITLSCVFVIGLVAIVAILSNVVERFLIVKSIKKKNKRFKDFVFSTFGAKTLCSFPTGFGKKIFEKKIVLNPEITIFNTYKDIEGYNCSFSEILNRIKNGSASRTLIEKIRVETDKSKRNELKKSLPSICFSGKFKKRSIKGLIEHSGLICLDFDNFETPEALEAYREILKLDAYIYCVFLSPSGNGLKALVKIPPSIEHHREFFRALQAKFDVPYFDESCVNVYRVCYESFDPDLYINENAIMWEELPAVKIYSSTNETISFKKESDKLINTLTVKEFLNK